MQPFTQLDGLVAPMDRANVDTDLMVPKQFLKSIRRSGFGPNLFDELRYLDVGEPDADNSQRPLNPDFPLNFARYEGASILLARENFGCGSSREHAVWALRDFGFKSVIASSFGDIFYNNCFKNSVLPIKLSKEQINHLFEVSNFAPVSFEIDLLKKELKYKDDSSYMFDVKDSLLDRIINNLDDVDMTLKHKKHIQAFEQKRRNQRPWLFDYSN